MNLLDDRFAGLAKGVGTAKILGRVHAAQFMLGKSHFEASITVIQNQDMDFLFGLDLLKRYQVSHTFLPVTLLSLSLSLSLLLVDSVTFA